MTMSTQKWKYENFFLNLGSSALRILIHSMYCGYIDSEYVIIKFLLASPYSTYSFMQIIHIWENMQKN